MKKRARIGSYAILCLSIVLAPYLATAQPQGAGQGQVSGVTNVSPSQSQDASAQIQGMAGAIKDMQQAIEDAMKELQQMIDDLNQLRSELPTGPQGNSSQDKDSYYKRRTEWQYKVTAKEHQIVAKQAKINQLQKQLSDLQQQLANLQRAAGDNSGKSLPPVKVIPKK
jgi:septal ring factor EnvC (AmiA/AmiB activator)